MKLDDIISDKNFTRNLLIAAGAIAFMVLLIIGIRQGNEAQRESQRQQEITRNYIVETVDQKKKVIVKPDAWNKTEKEIREDLGIGPNEEVDIEFPSVLGPRPIDENDSYEGEEAPSTTP